jgi:hypothetical protein
MSEPSGAVRVLVVLLLGGLVALFIALAMDMAVPAPTDPDSVSMEVQATPEQQAAIDKQYADLSTRLDRGEITQDEYDQQLTALDAARNGSDSAGDPSPAAYDAYTKAESHRSLVIALVGAVLAALLLAGGVILTRREVALGPVPLFAGGLLGLYVMGSAATAEPVWLRIVVGVVVAFAAVLAGVLLFTRPAEDPVDSLA